MVTTFVHGYIDTVREAPFLPGYVLAELHHDPTRMRTLVQRLSGRDPGRWSSRASRACSACSAHDSTQSSSSST